jgi:hypothetical protein
MIPITPRRDRRHVFLDIETVSTSNDPEGALFALSGRIVCVGLLIDDGTTLLERTLIDPDERAMLQELWAAVRPTDVFAGHNIWQFDLPYIRQRSWINGVRPSRRIDLRRFYSVEVLDTQQIFSNWGATRFPKLDDLARALECGEKSGNGSDVADWWRKGEFERITRYCQLDVRLSFKVFAKLMFRPIPDRFSVLETSDPLLGESAEDRPPIPQDEKRRDNLIIFPKWRLDSDSTVDPKN